MIARLLPPKVRRVVYIVLAVATAVESVWDVVPPALEGRVLATLTVLGFSLATANVPREEDRP